MAHDATLPTVRGVLMPSFYGYSQYKIRQRQGWTEKYERDDSGISRGANQASCPTAASFAVPPVEKKR